MQKAANLFRIFQKAKEMTLRNMKCALDGQPRAPLLQVFLIRLDLSRQICPSYHYFFTEIPELLECIQSLRGRGCPFDVPAKNRQNVLLQKVLFSSEFQDRRSKGFNKRDFAVKFMTRVSF